MIARSNSSSQWRTVLMMGLQASRSGGMALKVRALKRLLRTEGNFVDYFQSNKPFPAGSAVSGLDSRVAAVRPLGNDLWMKLWRKVRHAELVDVLAASWYNADRPTLWAASVQ